MKQTGTPAGSAAPSGASSADAGRFRHPVNRALVEHPPVGHRTLDLQQRDMSQVPSPGEHGGDGAS